MSIYRFWTTTNFVAHVQYKKYTTTCTNLNPKQISFIKFLRLFPWYCSVTSFNYFLQSLAGTYQSRVPSILPYVILCLPFPLLSVTF